MKNNLNEMVTTSSIAITPTKTTEIGMASKNKPDECSTGKADTKMKKLGEYPKKKIKNSPKGVAEEITDNYTKLQQLFNEYVRTTDVITTNEFNTYCESYGFQRIDTDYMRSMLEQNKQYLFAESSNNGSVYWIKQQQLNEMHDGYAGVEDEVPPMTNYYDDYNDETFVDHDDLDGMDADFDDCCDIELEIVDEPYEDDSMEVGIEIDPYDNDDINMYDDDEYYESFDNIDENILLETDGKVMDGPSSSGLVDRQGKGGARMKKVPYEDTKLQKLGDKKSYKLKNTIHNNTVKSGGNPHKPDDTFQSHLAGSELGQKQHNKGGNWEEFKKSNLSGNSKKMYENIEKLKSYIATMVETKLKNLNYGKAGKYPVIFQIEAGESINTRSHANLTEAVADLEELLQIMAPEDITFTVECNNNNEVIPLIMVKNRGPIVSENKVIFRIPEVARGFADLVVREGKVCRATTHSFGAAVSAPINESTVNKLYKQLKSVI